MMLAVDGGLETKDAGMEDVRERVRAEPASADGASLVTAVANE